jgi:hypothetical protein
MGDGDGDVMRHDQSNGIIKQDMQDTSKLALSACQLVRAGCAVFCNLLLGKGNTVKA